MALARVHTWAAGEVLLASDLNAEYNNILNNAADLVSPFTKAVSMGGFALNFDAANTIALTATTSGITLTGGTLREGTEDTITAHAGGTQALATALSVTKKFHRISVCATTADSVVLPTSTAGQAHFVRNDGAAAAQVFGTSPDTINSVATATGVPLPAGIGTWYVCVTAGNWVASQPAISVSGAFAVTLTATATTNVTLPTTGTLATLAGSESLSAKTLVNPANTTQALTDAASVVWDASLGGTATLTLGGNRTMAAPSNLKTGGRYVLHVTQDGTGSRTLAFNAVFKSLDGVIPQPSGAIAAITLYVFESPDGTNLNLVAPRAVPRSALAGLTLSTAGGSTTMTTALGQAADSTNAVLMNLLTATGKTTASWAVGTGNGGLDNGAIATGTWYHFFLIMRPDTGVVDVLFSTSPSAPTMPTSYIYKRRIGAGKTDGSSQWTLFTQEGDTFLWAVPVSDYASANPGTSAVTRTLTVPTGVVVLPVHSVLITQGGTGAATYALITSLATTDTAPSATLFTVATGTDAGAVQNTASIVTNITTNTSAQIRSRVSNSAGGTTLSGATHGWVDHRGRDA